MSTSDLNATILSSAVVTVPSGQKKELFMTLSSLFELIKSEEGCCDYRCYRDSKEDDKYVLIGEWRCTRDWERHQRSENFTVLMGTMGVLGQGKEHRFNVSTLIR